MKISNIDILPVRIPLKGSFQNVRRAKTDQNSVRLKVCADDGVLGSVNVDLDPGYSEEGFHETLDAVRRLAGGLIGLDPMKILSILEHLDKALPGNLDAKAASKVAIFDLKGKALGVPVHSLIGVQVREEIYLNGWIGISPSDETARDRIKAVREVVGNAMALRVDANEDYSVDDAARLARAISPYDITLFEQPLQRRDLVSMTQVRKAVDILVCNSVKMTSRNHPIDISVLFVPGRQAKDAVLEAMQRAVEEGRTAH